MIKFYSFVIHASWPNRIGSAEASGGTYLGVNGLVCTKLVHANSYEAAVAKVKNETMAMLEREFSRYEGYVPPAVELDQVTRIGMLRYLFPSAATRGFTFYSED
ncbi:hypothetical protein [Pseudokordiimonas caeni]|uniref:hypothetical protein n=1 Tax=Pseudokordiimonas caeni TaxID=2997908 RepID=UPI002812714D|nr:hypothetical protein [Pseudokordiimonas caeni]